MTNVNEGYKCLIRMSHINTARNCVFLHVLQVHHFPVPFTFCLIPVVSVGSFQSMKKSNLKVYLFHYAIQLSYTMCVTAL